MGNPVAGENEYLRKIEQQVEQYSRQADIHDLPPIYHYWSNKHLLPKLMSVMEEQQVAAFYARYFGSALQARSDTGRLLSLGSGDGSLEIEIALLLLNRGISNFIFDCCELSPVLIERARARLNSRGLADYFVLSQTDLNAWCPEGRYDGAMAHHSLHHIVELEHVFSGLRAALAPDGVFLSFDMIGRNGHQRWPEALSLIEEIWKFLPDSYKYNHQLRRLDSDFVNWDCSQEGFEGVRAQDILPLLLESFSFQRFLGFANLIEVFVGRGYGPNFSAESAGDRLMIDILAATDDALLSQGVMKPTQMCAVMRPSAGRLERCWGRCSPEFCVRPAGYQTTELGREYLAGAGGGADFILGSGWSYPEDNHRWSDGQQAQLRFRFSQLPSRQVRVRLECGGYLNERLPKQRILVKHLGRTIHETELTMRNNAGIDFLFSPKLTSGTLEVCFPDAGRPSDFALPDNRLLGISLRALIFEEN